MSLVLVSQLTSICCRRMETVADGNSQKHGTTTLRPGLAMRSNRPNFSTSVTVPVLTVMNGMQPHDMGSAWRAETLFLPRQCLEGAVSHQATVKL